MELFFELEIVYIVIGIFILSVTAFVTTRSFVPKGAFKKGILSVGSLILVMILAHFYLTVDRMNSVQQAFNDGKTIICENKMHRTISRSVLLSKDLEWRLDGDLFKSDNYTRDFHSSRCLVYKGIAPK